MLGKSTGIDSGENELAEASDVSIDNGERLDALDEGVRLYTVRCATCFPARRRSRVG